MRVWLSVRITYTDDLGRLSVYVLAERLKGLQNYVAFKKSRRLVDCVLSKHARHCQRAPITMMNGQLLVKYEFQCELRISLRRISERNR